MTFNSKILETTVSSLYRDGLLRDVTDVAIAKESQLQQLHALLGRLDNAELVQNYLIRYDACMRIIEIILLEYGFQLNEQPHATARRIVSAIDSSIDFREIAKTRHAAKKQSISPPQDVFTDLIRLQKFLENIFKEIQ